MNSTAVKDFFDWYKSWYKPIAGEMNIMFSVPNELHLQEFRMLMVEENVVVLELFEKIDQGIDAKVYMRQICDKADELGITIYLEPMPRYKYFRKNIEKRKKVSKEYLFAYYAGFGFEPTSDKRFMKRTPKMNDRKEFYTRTYADGTEQRFSVEDYEKNVLPTLGEGGKFHLGGDMSKHLAPNGKPSNLTHEQWHLVRTPEFKNWFGDWENDPENASKVVDDNGEPLIVWHGSPNDFTVFEYGEFGFHFGGKQAAEERGAYLNSFFLNIKKMLWFDYDLGDFNSINMWREYVDFFEEEKYADFRNALLSSNNIDAFKDKIIKIYDGIKYFNAFEGDIDEHSYMVFSPNNIKLADGSNTTFDGSNPDIRYAKGGVFPSLITSYSQLGW